MAGLNYSYGELATVRRKLREVLKRLGSGKEDQHWLVWEGQELWRVTFPNEHGGGSSPSKGFIRSVMRDLHLHADRELFQGLAHCPKDLADYLPVIESHVRAQKES